MALLHQAAFGRAPDLDGLNFYLGRGVDARAVARAILASPGWSAAGSVKVADKANTDVDTLLGIERGEFADGAVDLAFTQAQTGNLATIGLLYQAVLDRAGDHGGLAWWSGIGLDAAALARAFTASGEFGARYGAMSDAAFVAALYANSNLDTGAAGGSGAWVAMLHDHSRAELAGAWIAQDAVRDAHFGNSGLWLA